MFYTSLHSGQRWSCWQGARKTFRDLFGQYNLNNTPVCIRSGRTCQTGGSRMQARQTLFASCKFFKMRGSYKKCLFTVSYCCPPEPITSSPHFQIVALPTLVAKFCLLNYCSLQDSEISLYILDFYLNSKVLCDLLDLLLFCTTLSKVFIQTELVFCIIFIQIVIHSF